MGERNLNEALIRRLTITLSKALEFSSEARVICFSRSPNIILYANKAWTTLTSLEQHEIMGKNLLALEGPLTNLDNMKLMMHNIRFGGYGTADVILYTKCGQPFASTIMMRPIVSEDQDGESIITHYLGVITNSEFNTGHKRFKTIETNLTTQKAVEYDWVIADSLKNEVDIRMKELEGGKTESSFDDSLSSGDESTYNSSNNSIIEDIITNENLLSKRKYTN